MSAPATESAESTGSLTEEQAFERYMERSAPPPDDRRRRAPAAQASEADEPGDVPIEDDEPIDETLDDAIETEDLEAVDADEPEADPSDPIIRFDDGSELALSEVKRGFLRQQDYTRKTQETAELRKAVESERAQYLAEKKHISDQLTPLIQQAESILNNPSALAELEELRQIDPGAYAVKMMDRQQKQAQLQQLEWQRRQLADQAEREEAERFQRERAETANQSRAVLMEKIPAAKKDFASWYKQLGQYVLEQGIPVESWDNEVDHRVITLAWKAMQYDAATRKAPATENRLRKAPQTMRPGAARPPGHARERELREATERAHKSGTVEDLADLLLKRQQARRRR